MSQAGVLLFAHGARDPAWAIPFEAVATRLREHAPDVEVRLAFLEFMQPELRAAAEELVRSGCRRVCIVPLFLGAGGHVRKDLPELLASLQADHPQVRWTLAGAIGEQPQVIAAMAEAALALSTTTTTTNNSKA